MTQITQMAPCAEAARAICGHLRHLRMKV